MAHGQIKEQSVLLGGQVQLIDSKIDYTGAPQNSNAKFDYFNLSVGKFFQENTAFGLNISYGQQPQKTEDSNGTISHLKTNQYAAGIFVRRYHQLVKDLYFFTELGASYIGSNHSIKTLTTETSKSKMSGGRIFITPGISYRILGTLQVELVIPSIVAVQYAVTKTSLPAPASKQTDFNFNTNLNPSGLDNVGLGFHFIF